MGAQDEDPELAAATTIEAALELLVARKLQERFPRLGLSARGARAIAGAVVPAGAHVVRVDARRGGIAVALEPTAAPARRQPSVRARRLIGGTAAKGSTEAGEGDAG